jgi:hypothetical protein
MSNLTLSDNDVRNLLSQAHIRVGVGNYPVAVLAVRDADGDGNEFGVYDDRLYVVTPSVVHTFSGNTDPSAYAQGRAQMETGQTVWYQAGKHKLAYPAPRGYPAFRQVKSAWFNRRGQGREFGNIAANLHHGGVSGGTSSLACQTVPIGDWDRFRNIIYTCLGVTSSQVLASPLGTGVVFPYRILSREDVRRGLLDGSQPQTPQGSIAPTWQYLYKGTTLSGVVSVAGSGYAPTRDTLSLLTGIPPKELVFVSAVDGLDEDTSPDLQWIDPVTKQKHPLDVLDKETPKTLSQIVDMLAATGKVWKVNDASKVVTISDPTI